MVMGCRITDDCDDGDEDEDDGSEEGEDEEVPVGGRGRRCVIFVRESINQRLKIKHSVNQPLFESFTGRMDYFLRFWFNFLSLGEFMYILAGSSVG